MPSGHKPHFRGDQIADGVIVDSHISDTAAVQEKKLHFDVLAGHNHDGVNSALLLGSSVGTTAMQSLSSVTVTGPGTSFNLTNARANLGLQVACTGSPTTVLINLEGSLEGTHWFTLAHSSNISGEIVFASNVPVIWLRANLTTLTGGSSPTVSAWLVAV
jgi:hypothetical protein